MAKFGEADPRWIVKEREDGTNVHNWHWTEKDCVEWSKERLGELFEDLDLLDGSDVVCARTCGVQSVTGEAFTNNRKNKIIASYELEIKIKWNGEVKDGDGNVVEKATGFIHVPYLADENADEDPEIRVAVDHEDNAGAKLKDAVYRNGKKKIESLLAIFVKELAAGGPDRKEAAGKLPASKPVPQKQVPQSRSEPSAQPSKPKESSSSQSLHNLKLKEKYYASTRDIFECFVNPAKFQAFTQSEAKIDPRPGGSFSWFGGSVTGQFKDIQENKKLVMDWRFSNWEDGVHSQVTMDIESPESGTTVILLCQTGIPEEDRYGNEDVKRVTENGWRMQILHRIRAVFGYGI